ncbi:conserved hypothetical protein [Treponema paraluiscuniculi Cuniculi A]|uniref:Peptidase M15C domain-containing protein n=1 Tax=Treponema paraluiscuniculi (strain Cuniculi A) TaxID=545776 RepID=F7XT34_TREPU|nr:M15 family metallopeptidase [Treponema paraluiscuniculi]AEH40531.1 conserved hypothetical protein [Treponema paraluiscuniculi Cuniculi A]
MVFRRTVALALLLRTLPCAAHFGNRDRTFYDLNNAPLALRAIQDAYPHLNAVIAYDPREQDWLIRSDGRTLYWAEGRLLPREHRDQAHDWRPIIDYVYAREVLDPAHLFPEEIHALRPKTLAIKRSATKPYHDAFFTWLYGPATRSEINARLARGYMFLGKPVYVHKALITRLNAVQEKILTAAKTHAHVQKFIEDLLRVDGFNWREISDSRQKSNHSWGIALDLMPKNWQRHTMYWNWEAAHNEDWMHIPIKKRWAPPAEIISLFESEGFIWGGHWMLWDTMHFEYRPELLAVRKILSEGNRYDFQEQNIVVHADDFPAQYFSPKEVFGTDEKEHITYAESCVRATHASVKELVRARTLVARFSPMRRLHVYAPPESIHNSIDTALLRMTAQLKKNYTNAKIRNNSRLLSKKHAQTRASRRSADVYTVSCRHAQAIALQYPHALSWQSKERSYALWIALLAVRQEAARRSVCTPSSKEQCMTHALSSCVDLARTHILLP